jgi:hypothetical protein
MTARLDVRALLAREAESCFHCEHAGQPVECMSEQCVRYSLAEVAAIRQAIERLEGAHEQLARAILPHGGSRADRYWTTENLADLATVHRIDSEFLDTYDMACPEGDLYGAMARRRLEHAKAEADLAALQAEHQQAMKQLNPACADETLIGAIRNVQQAYLSQSGNIETLEAKLQTLQAEHQQVLAQIRRLPNPITAISGGWLCDWCGANWTDDFTPLHATDCLALRRTQERP